MTGSEGSYEVRGRRFAVVVARFNELVTEKLLEGTVAALRRHGVAEGDVEVFRTPGAFELPLVTQRLAGSGQFDAVIALGTVIRGETPHFDFVAGEAAAGIRRAAQDSGVPCIFGVLTTETLEQALERAGGKHGNKGWEAGLAAMEMADLLDDLPKQE